MEQKLSKFPCYSKIPKPFDQPDETDIIAVRDIFNKAKQEVIDSEDMEAQNYLTSNECVIKCTLHTLYFELYHNVPNGLVGFDSLASYL